MSALIMIRRKMTPATTQTTINVIFERRKDVALGNISKLFKKKKNKKQKNKKFFLHRLYIV